METESVFFTESTFYNSFMESELPEFNLQAVSSPGDEDEDEGENDDSEEDTEENEKYKGDTSSGDDDPPLDTDVKHSPVTTLPGGVPKKS